MDKDVIYVSFIVPTLFAIMAMYIGMTATDWYVAAGAGFLLITAFVSALFIGIILFVLRSRNLLWWHGILISIGSVILSIVLTPFAMNTLNILFG